MERLNEELCRVPLSSRHISMHDAQTTMTRAMYSLVVYPLMNIMRYLRNIFRAFAKLVPLKCQPARIYFLVSSPLGLFLLLSQALLPDIVRRVAGKKNVRSFVKI